MSLTVIHFLIHGMDVLDTALSCYTEFNTGTEIQSGQPQCMIIVGNCLEANSNHSDTLLDLNYPTMPHKMGIIMLTREFLQTCCLVEYITNIDTAQ